MNRSLRWILLSLAAFFLFSACGGGYITQTRSAREAFEQRNFQAAEAGYQEGAEQEGLNQLLYLFDRSMIRHTAGDLEGSNRDLLFADKLSEIKDYTALAAEVATIVTNDNIIPYKGEEFETVLVSALLAINFTLQGKTESALVECRRVNRKLELLRAQGKRDYELNAFAQYLSGVLYEKDRNWNSAFVDYRKTFEIQPSSQVLRKDILRGLLKLGSDSQFDLWKKKLQYTKEELQEAENSLRKDASVVLLYQNGFAPEKVVSPHWHELPAYQSRFNRHRAANLYLNGEFVARSELLYDVDKAAKKNLEQKYALYIAKRVAGVVAREVIGNEVGKRTNSPELGAVVKIAMYMASKPDLRAWLTLPQNFQVARAYVAPGRYRAEIRLENMQGIEEAPKDLGEVEVKRPGDMAILSWRSLND